MKLSLRRLQRISLSSKSLDLLLCSGFHGLQLLFKVSSRVGLFQFFMEELQESRLARHPAKSLPDIGLQDKKQLKNSNEKVRSM
jgi:hypothetical protein